MKRSWIPAAITGALALGYLAGARGRGPRDEVPQPTYVPVEVLAPAATPPPAGPAQQPPVEPPFAPIMDPVPDDGLGEYPAWNGIDLDCPDIGHPVRVTGPDPHRLDGDGNGVGCESY